MAKNENKAKARKLAKQQKRALRAEADKARFQRSDRKSISTIVGNRDADATLQAVSGASSVDGYRVSSRQKQSKKAKDSPKQHMLLSASIVLALAAGVFILMALLAGSGIAGAETALRAFGGNYLQPRTDNVPDIYRVVFLLDTLLPMLLGAGFAMLLTSVQTRGNRPLVRLGLTALLLAVLADFTENALVFSALEQNLVSPLQVVASVIKYGLFALSAVIASALLPVRGLLGRFVNIFLLFVFPFAVALTVSAIGAEEVFGIKDDNLFLAGGASFFVVILGLAIYAAMLGDEEPAQV